MACSDSWAAQMHFFQSKVLFVTCNKDVMKWKRFIRIVTRGVSPIFNSHIFWGDNRRMLTEMCASKILTLLSSSPNSHLSPQYVKRAPEPPRSDGFQPVDERCLPMTVILRTPTFMLHLADFFLKCQCDEANRKRHLQHSHWMTAVQQATGLQTPWGLVVFGGTVAQKPAAMSLLCVRGKLRSVRLKNMHQYVNVKGVSKRTSFSGLGDKSSFYTFLFFYIFEQNWEYHHLASSTENI